MRTRLDFHEMLLWKVPTATKVYFQPPESLKLQYPCLIYSIETDENWNADNIKYINMLRYSVIAIDRNPDSQMLQELSDIPYSELDRTYTADNLNHFVFRIYY